MDSFIKTPQQQKIIEEIRSLQQSFEQREPELDAIGSFPHQNINDLKKIGYHTLTLPAEYGGQGFGLYEYILAQEAISQASGSTGLAIGWHTGIVLEFAENRHWQPEPAHWLMDAIKEGALINTAATESNAGSPTRGALPKTTALRDGDDFIVNGEKINTSMAPALDYIFVTAANEQDEMLTLVIPKSAAGVSIEQSWDMLAMRGTASQTLVLENVRIPASYVLKTAAAKAPAKGWLLHIPACYIGIALPHGITRLDLLHLIYRPHWANRFPKHRASKALSEKWNWSSQQPGTFYTAQLSAMSMQKTRLPCKAHLMRRK